MINLGATDKAPESGKLADWGTTTTGMTDRSLSIIIRKGLEVRGTIVVLMMPHIDQFEFTFFGRGNRMDLNSFTPEWDTALIRIGDFERQYTVDLII